MISAMLGLGQHAAPRRQAPLAVDIPANGPREHYMRAVVSEGAVTPSDRQDSSLLTVLATANALLVRPPSAPAGTSGTLVEIIDL
jgi:molybdopterin molybdotransferase